MGANFWYKQTDKPLFEDLLWSRPENKLHAGKLLIIGGNKYHFSAPGQAYTAASQAGVGAAKVLLPDALQKTIGAVLENCEFAPTNKSGSFARTALASWLDFASWSDAVLLAGDIGRNSETTIVLEEFVNKYSGQLVITQDALDQFLNNPQLLFEREQTVIVASFAQIQKMNTHFEPSRALTYDMSLVQIVEHLHELSKKTAAFIVTKHQDEIIIAVNGRVSTAKNTDEIWRVTTAAKMATWWLQNPGKVFEALTTSLIQA